MTSKAKLRARIAALEIEVEQRARATHEAIRMLGERPPPRVQTVLLRRKDADYVLRVDQLLDSGNGWVIVCGGMP